MKRLMDIAVSLAGIIALSPLFIVIALWVRSKSGKGPIFYCGERVGRHGKSFRIFKFRSMVENAESIGPSSSREDDPRVTVPGRFLRKHKLDELPQLMNVLRGDMSLVGPRPQIRWVVDLYSERERALLNMRPGITDYASLVFRNEAAILKGSLDSDKDYMVKIAPAKMRLALEYVHSNNVWTDCKIVLATVGCIFGLDPLWCFPASLKPTEAVASDSGSAMAIPMTKK